MKCVKCGFENINDAEFCGNCGFKQHSVPQTQQNKKIRKKIIIVSSKKE